mgnify:CR=1 FL=1
MCGLTEDEAALSAYVRTIVALRPRYDEAIEQQEDDKAEWFTKLVTELGATARVPR